MQSFPSLKGYSPVLTLVQRLKTAASYGMLALPTWEVAPPPSSQPHHREKMLPPLCPYPHYPICTPLGAGASVQWFLSQFQFLPLSLFLKEDLQPLFLFLFTPKGVPCELLKVVALVYPIPNKLLGPSRRNLKCSC